MRLIFRKKILKSEVLRISGFIVLMNISIARQEIVTSLLYQYMNGTKESAVQKASNSIIIGEAPKISMD